MAARYGHAWVSQYSAAPDGAAAAEWRETLGGLTQDHIVAGFCADAAHAASWPPSSTAFRRDCLGITSLAHVRAELQVRWSEHGAFTRAVWRALDQWAYQRADADRAERLLRDAYELTCEAVMRGELVAVESEQPVAAITQERREPEPPATAEQIAAHLAELDAAVGKMAAIQ